MNFLGVMTMPPIPASRSRANSRAGSRPASPTMSIRSRKSVMSTTRSKRRSSYLDPELTDDEDSEDDRRSMVSQRSGYVGPRRTRRISSASQSFEDDFMDNRLMKNNKNIRERRSVQNEWPQRRSSATQVTTKQKVTSDSAMTPESESEPQSAKAMVQAKIQEKINASIDKVPPPIPAPPNLEDEQIEVSKDELEEEPKIEQQPEERESSGDVESLGPPPSTPDHEWECEFCTFVNEPKVKICVVCCKTPVKRPAASVKAVKTEPASPVKTVKKEPTTILKPSIKESTKNTIESKGVADITTKMSNVDVKIQSEDQKKGRRNKRISFWLGTKVN